MAQHVTVNDFESEVLESKLPVLVDFYADWCGPCKMMSPVVDSLSEAMAAVVKICKCNVDDNGAIAEKYGIMSIPAFVIFKDGQPAATNVGAMSPAAFEKWIKENI
ncbi:MAG: thioredoxin [Lachnospiraceae bacterium]|nr:thioredoxin [Lachnospiraceae bacterium]